MDRSSMVAGAGEGDHPPGKMGEEKLIIRSEKVRFIDILSLLLLRRPITSYRFVDAGDRTAGDLAAGPGPAWVIALTEVIQKALAAAYYPVKWIGAAVEFVLNFVALNGGLLGIVWNIFRCKLVIPLNREAPNFQTIMALIDGRAKLRPRRHQLQVVAVSREDKDDVNSGGAAVAPLIGLQDVQKQDLDVTVIASKIVYENAAYIKNVVNNVWKFNFVGYYSCWNKFMGSDTTQAFVATDRADDATMIMVAFRGTSPFNTRQFATDVNLSWLGMGAMGHVHVGFLKALGLQEEDGNGASRAFPRDLPAGAAPAGKVVAYYKLRAVLRDLLDKHPNARFVVTGHSLGGALAVLFTAVLALHGEEDILGRLLAVRTYGQPRAGDATFAAFLRAALPRPQPAAAALLLLRVVYRYDVAARVPFDAPPFSAYKHGGGSCLYYDGWYHGRVLAAGEDVPDLDYFDPRYLVSMYGAAVSDLVKAMFLWIREGREYSESAVSIALRAAGLLFPGLGSHSPRDYVNAVRLGRVGVAPDEADDPSATKSSS